MLNDCHVLEVPKRMLSEWLYKLDDKCQSPLSRAVTSGHTALTELLLSQEIEDRTQSLEGPSLLHRAASLGLEEAIERSLSESGDPNELDKYDETPLHKAARHGHYRAAEILIRYGANPNAANMLGLTPLHWTALNGRMDVAELLLEAGADMHIADEYLDGLTPVALALIMGYGHLAGLFKTCAYAA
jgi:ankyrin repeat protein